MAGGGTLSRRGLLLASAGLLVAFAFVLGVSFAITPEDVETGRVVLTPTCHFKAIFGRECPTCGLTRAFAALSHGRLDDAWRYNRAGPLLYGLFWLAAAAAATTLLRTALRDPEERKATR